MDFLELVKKRQSDRGYLPDAVDRADIDRCIEAARLSPSACNSQPWHFVVVDEPELREKVAEETFGKLMSFNHFTMTAPVLVAIVSERQKASAKFGAIVKRKNFTQMDIAIAAEHFCLQASELGLGTCMLGWFDEKAVKKLLDIPRAKRVELIITLGKPKDETTRDKKRKTVDQIRSYNRYDR